MIINNFEKRIYYKKEDLVKKSKEKPIFYTIDVLIKTKKDEKKKTYLIYEDFNRISIKYKNKFNLWVKSKWFFEHLYRNFIIWLKTRKFKTTKEIHDFRWNTCQKCPELNEHKVCKSCNCYMPIKTTLSYAKCPLAKW